MGFTVRLYTTNRFEATGDSLPPYAVAILWEFVAHERQIGSRNPAIDWEC